MKKEIIVRFTIPGTHQWVNAFPQVSFLRNIHRHIFHVAAYFEVHDNDREIEFIYKEREIKAFLLQKYGDNGECNFGTLSCEDIAMEILVQFHANRVEVNEDGQGGAVIYE